MSKKKEKVGKTKKIIAGTIVASALVGAVGFWNLKTDRGVVELPTYRVEKVIDGDTFVTKEKRNIRLASVSSPTASPNPGPNYLGYILYPWARP